MNPIFDRNRGAGALLTAGVLLLIALYRAAGQTGPTEDKSNIGCVEHLEIPEYPPLARVARSKVTQIVKVLLSDHATIERVESSVQGKAANLLERPFKEGAEEALKNSRFSKTCSGKTITLVFDYEPSNDVRLWAFEPPNHFLIRTGSVTINPSVSGK
jgi:hypothetical protein